MRRVPPALLVLALVSGLLSSAPPALGARRKAGVDRLQMYTATVDSRKTDALVESGYDVVASRTVKAGTELDIVMPVKEAERLRAKGVDVRLWRNRQGLTAQQLAARQRGDGYRVWRSYDEQGGIEDEMHKLADKYPNLVKLVVLGKSARGRDIIALKVTKNAKATPDGKRPAVVYSSTQHAREWISTEVNRRLLRYYLKNYEKKKKIKKLLGKRELWFLLVSNPDGYEYTFDKERLWRKNLRDNDKDGKITVMDGVDLNRNFPENWGYDNEGSASLPADLTYRGPAPASEPETKAMIKLFDLSKPEMQINYHSYGQLLLYPVGWQQETYADDHPIYLALSGTDKEPAIKGYDPDLGAELYTTNGDTNDWAHADRRTLSWTPELGEGKPGNGFVFPDNPKLVQREFRINKPFALDVAKSAGHPARPSTHLDRKAPAFDVHEFSESWGDPQTVEVNAKRSLGEIKLRYRINNDNVRTAGTSEWKGGERYGSEYDVYYHRLRGKVRGTSPGDRVKVWFTGGGKKSQAFTYRARKDTNDPVLILAAEDYTGASNFPAYENSAGPNFLKYYTDALSRNGIFADVYDVDAQNRRAPDSLGVLSHYKAVVWYTGNDVIPREPDMVPGTVSKLAHNEMLEVRDYLNEGGRLLHTGKYAGLPYFGQLYEYDPTGNDPCDPESFDDGCVPLQDDFHQYWLGAYFYNASAGLNEETEAPFAVEGTDQPFGGMQWDFSGSGAGNQDDAASFLATSGILPVSKYPQFESWPSAKYVRAGGPFDPHTGQFYAYSQISDVSYKRLTRTISVPAGGGELTFWTSYNTEADWDYFFVEAHTPGQNDWTTLPDENGNTSQETGDSCPEGWADELHPHLFHYQSETCEPTGSTGEWHAASGSSGGWKQWSVDLSEWAGEDVEISLSYASDWSTQGLGVFLDDIDAPGTEGDTSFEDDFGGWEVSGAPAESAPSLNDWVRTTAAGFPEGAVVSTEDTIYMGFGLEGVAGENERAAIMGRAMKYLLRP